MDKVQNRKFCLVNEEMQHAPTKRLLLVFSPMCSQQVPPPQSSQCVPQHVLNSITLYPISFAQCWSSWNLCSSRNLGTNRCVYVWNEYFLYWGSLQRFTTFFVMGQLKRLLATKKNLNLEGNMDHTHKQSTQTHTNVTKHVHKPCRPGI